MTKFIVTKTGTYCDGNYGDILAIKDSKDEALEFIKEYSEGTSIEERERPTKMKAAWDIQVDDDDMEGYIITKCIV